MLSGIFHIPSHDDRNGADRRLEKIVRILVRQIARIVVSDLGHDVAAQQLALGRTARLNLSHRVNELRVNECHFSLFRCGADMMGIPHEMVTCRFGYKYTFVMISGVSKSQPPTRRMPHGVCVPSRSSNTANSCNLGGAIAHKCVYVRRRCSRNVLRAFGFLWPVEKLVW